MFAGVLQKGVIQDKISGQLHAKPSLFLPHNMIG